ncbi:unnamed protein product [Brachionus calyciflorus]|uniref:C-type lectin domain-containing protein n=1 Tax=Brachionus calyciflorus TaxID=104777 RepID=A0A814DXD1_9BILA|nr:unnamed protein product [Brachionus calyciflorus]
MKETLRFIICLGFYIKKIWSSYSDQFDSTFIVKNFTLTTYDSLIFQEILIDKFLCLQKCSIDPYCLYIQYEGNNCSLYSEDATNKLVFSNDKIIYQKSNYENQPKLVMENQNYWNVSCINSTYYWSSNTSSCKSCKTGFIKYSELPFNCYHNQTGWRNFTESKSYCQSKGGVLFRPKTENERSFLYRRFPSIFPFLRVSVDSTITSVGQEFKWPDGSNVVGFEFQPNNWLGSESFLNEDCLELLHNGYFNDIPCSFSYGLTICQQQ